MKFLWKRGGGRGFTVVELLAMVAVIFILVVLFLPMSGSILPRRRMGCGPDIHCVSNLKQVGLAFRLWAGDNNEIYPMRALTNQTGGPLFADTTNGFRYFQVMSNELSTPKVVVCPADTRSAATNFTTDFSSIKVSYFVGLTADELLPGAWLSGDRNITNGQKPINGMLEVQTNQNIGWTSELHNGAGNISLADGSVQRLRQSGLKACLANSGLATNRLLFP
jgi:prepilin-type processing-associated H-X9-DG protein